MPPRNGCAGPRSPMRTSGPFSVLGARRGAGGRAHGGPRGHALVREGEGHELGALLLERGRDLGARVRATEEHEVTAAPRAWHLSADRPGAPRCVVERVDGVGRDALVEALL